MQKQIESIRKQQDPRAEKIVERVSLSENEKEVYNTGNVSSHNSSLNNDVYRYFTQSAKTDSDLFNYKKYFSDIRLDPTIYPIERSKPEGEQALKKFEVKGSMPKKMEIDKCSCQVSCLRCRKKLEMLCNECKEHDDKVVPETTNQPQIEYNEPELPFSNQQVVVYRPSEQHAPYSFNVEENSLFYKDALTEMRMISEQKLSNYIKLYGDLRNKKRDDTKKQTQTVLSEAPATILQENPQKVELNTKWFEVHLLIFLLF